MLGFPNGLTDQSSRLPLTRRGITATPLNRRFNGGREFLVDIACYPGSSGSPVFIFDRSSYFDRTTMTFKIGQRLLLVGILFAGPTINQAGSIVLDTVPSVQMSLMMHLGNCIDARVLFEFDEAIKNFQTG